jgi:hypothetical protein
MSREEDFDRAISFYRLSLFTYPKFFESMYALGLALKKKVRVHNTCM